MNKIIITGRIPSKKNSKIMVCRGRIPILLSSQKYTEWHKDASVQLAQQRLLGGKPSFKNGTKLTITFYLPDNRRTDLTNKAESIMDMLVDNDFLEDDNWLIVPELLLKCGGVDKNNPRCVIEY